MKKDDRITSDGTAADSDMQSIVNTSASIEANPMLPAVRPAVAWFATKMEAKLASNDHKGGWAECEVDWLFKRLKQETKEFKERWDTRLWSMQGRSASENVPLIDVDDEVLINECADIANFAMMIADMFGKQYGR